MGYQVFSGGIPRRYGLLWKGDGPIPKILVTAPFSPDGVSVRLLAERLNREQTPPETFRDRFLAGVWT